MLPLNKGGLDCFAVVGPSGVHFCIPLYVKCTFQTVVDWYRLNMAESIA